MRNNNNGFVQDLPQFLKGCIDHFLCSPKENDLKEKAPFSKVFRRSADRPEKHSFSTIIIHMHGFSGLHGRKRKCTAN